MFSNNNGSTTAVWMAMLACTATAALAAKVHLGGVDVSSSETIAEAAVVAAPAAPMVAAPVLERADLEEPRRFSIELRRPDLRLPVISRDDYANTLVDRLLAAERVRAAPAPVAVEAPEIAEARFEDPAVRGTELPRPDRPRLPAVRP